jgi:hypothetical protein
MKLGYGLFFHLISNSFVTNPLLYHLSSDKKYKSIKTKTDKTQAQNYYFLAENYSKI